MNSLGRHYRDPTNPNQPSCNYEADGVRCSFFTDSEFASLPYPDDISFGPVSDPSPNTDLATILAALNMQKEEADAHRKRQDEQMKLLQSQVNGLLQGATQPPISSITDTMTTQALSTRNLTTTVVTTTVNSQPTVMVQASAPQIIAPPVLAQTTAPHVISNAAANLNAALQAGLGQERNHGFPGLTIGDLRANQYTTAQAKQTLAEATRDVPALNPHIMDYRLQQNQVTNVDQLYRATTVNKQLRAFEFASTGQFSYRNQLKIDNVNAVTFAYGALKHLEAIKSGLIGYVSDAEFLSRVRHLRNVFEIACLSSNLNSFSDPAWQIAREYDCRVIADIESGAKSWESLSNSIEPDSIYCAKETVENRNRQNRSKKVNLPNSSLKKEGDKPSKKVCTTYNSHRSSEGCYFEQQNEGKTCVYAHYCNWCKTNRNVEEKHKSLNCEHKNE